MLQQQADDTELLGSIIQLPLSNGSEVCYFHDMADGTSDANADGHKGVAMGDVATNLCLHAR